MDALRTKYHRMLAGERTAERLMQVIDFLLGQPVVNVRQVEKGIPEFSYHAAQRYFETLEQYSILREITGQARNRIYRAGEIMQVLDAPANAVD